MLQTKRIGITAVVLLLSMLLCSLPGNAGGDGCEKSPCRAGDKYDIKQGRCETEPGFWGYRSHYAPDCGEGYDFDRTRGVCVRKGECCEKLACEGRYKWDSRDSRCEADPVLFGYRSHYVPVCERGWDLDKKTGLCKKRGCGISTPGVRGELFNSKPDLVVQSFGLLNWGSCRPGNVVFTFQVTVANIGVAASAGVLVQAMDQHGTTWGNGVRVGVIDPGRARTVTISLFYLAGLPNHMTAAAPHPFKAIVDAWTEVDESNESNNESAAINVGAPRGCR